MNLFTLNVGRIHLIVTHYKAHLTGSDFITNKEWYRDDSLANTKSPLQNNWSNLGSLDKRKRNLDSSFVEWHKEIYLMEGETYTYLVLDDGPDGFIKCDGKNVIHSTFRHATTWFDNEGSLFEIEKVKKYAPHAKLMRVTAHVEPV